MYRIPDFETRCKKIYRMKVSPFGWIGNPIEIEYGTLWLEQHDPEPAVCMRVVGTDHFWAVFETQLYQISHGDYASYFTKQLEEFRLDFLVWIKDVDYWQQPWVREYYEAFKGRFYDFSEQEQKDYERAKSEFTGATEAIRNIAKAISERPSR